MLWVGGVMTATATREVGRDVMVWEMGRAGTWMSGSERVVKHILIFCKGVRCIYSDTYI